LKVSDRRIAEWWEAPGIEGREAFDEEVLYLNSLVEEIALPRWAILVRDRMPRWGFEPCAHRFLEGLEQVLSMIGTGRACARFGGCGDVPLSVRRELDQLGTSFLRWADVGSGNDPAPGSLGLHTADRAEAARAVGEVVLGAGKGPAVLDETIERWAEQARFPLARTLVDGEEAPLAVLARHACCYSVLWNIERLAHGIGNGEQPSVLACVPALRVAPKLDPLRISTLRDTAQGLAGWLQDLPPNGALEARIHALVGPRDEVRRWLVASLYKTLKLWQVQLDKLFNEKHTYMSLIVAAETRQKRFSPQ